MNSVTANALCLLPGSAMALWDKNSVIILPKIKFWALHLSSYPHLK